MLFMAEFVSLACCADSNFTDKKTTIIWKPDDSWFPDRTGCRNESKPVVNTEAYNKSRLFNIDSGKRCYNLTTIENEDYLVRGTFLFGDELSTTLDTSFNVLVGASTISLVMSSSKDMEVEGIFRATENHIDFCLQKIKGDPYILKVELRPLKNSEYLQGLSSPSLLKLVRRVDLGGTVDIRYASTFFASQIIKKMDH
jgi:hypothetical protein